MGTEDSAYLKKGTNGNWFVRIPKKDPIAGCKYKRHAEIILKDIRANGLNKNHEDNK